MKKIFMCMVNSGGMEDFTGKLCANSDVVVYARMIFSENSPFSEGVSGTVLNLVCTQQPFTVK